ncbi:ABC transporter permease subunit [Elioraea sp. Yellowstone]|jgi:putative spermidine/putrescine transport system permease protein|uniref:ABC transporter permease n=1 Tax=Elioraea sp. Yellowstone TaxID=2592070 RepID=UPI0011536714|nr:ABC transporter permease subunit [Elioraea sp. Yellowstone]TQF84502.1 ABC transporter permease subunit [Elioraea sp. Yellowstone]
MRRGAGFWAGLALAVLVALFLIGPVVLSVLAGLTRNYQRGILESGVTLAWIGRVLDLYAHTIWLSVGIALATLAATLILGVPVAYALARRPGRAARLFEEMLVMPVAIPGIATALALILAWGAVGSFRSHWSFILAGHVLFTLPFMVRATLAVMLAVDLATLEEGARSLGAGFLVRFRTIVLPNAMPGILAGALMVVTLSLGEFNMTLLLHTPFTMTLPVGLADAYASMRLEIGSAFTLVFLVLLVPLLVALQWAADAAAGMRRR